LQGLFKKGVLKKPSSSYSPSSGSVAENEVENSALTEESAVKNDNKEEDFQSLLIWLAEHLKRMNFAKYAELTQNPRRVFLINLLAGIGRGFGFAIGFTLLGFIGFYIIKSLDFLNLPLIGDFIADLMRYVENSMGSRI
jgi:hypothetical protein